MKTKPIPSKKILLTCGTSALAQRVAQRFLRDQDVRFASSEPIPQVLLKVGPYDQLSPSSHPAFIHELLKLTLDKGIEVVLPLGRMEMDVLADAHTLFSEYGIQLCSPSREQLSVHPWVQQPPAAWPLELFGLETPEEASVIGPGLFTRSDDGTYYLCSAG